MEEEKICIDRPSTSQTPPPCLEREESSSNGAGAKPKEVALKTDKVVINDSKMGACIQCKMSPYVPFYVKCCGYTACEPCFTKSHSENGGKCPKCAKPFEILDLIPHRKLEKLIHLHNNSAYEQMMMNKHNDNPNLKTRAWARDVSNKMHRYCSLSELVQFSIVYERAEDEFGEAVSHTQMCRVRADAKIGDIVEIMKRKYQIDGNLVNVWLEWSNKPLRFEKYLQDVMYDARASEEWDVVLHLKITTKASKERTENAPVPSTVDEKMEKRERLVLRINAQSLTPPKKKEPQVEEKKEVMKEQEMVEPLVEPKVEPEVVELMVVPPLVEPPPPQMVKEPKIEEVEEEEEEMPSLDVEGPTSDESEGPEPIDNDNNPSTSESGPPRLEAGMSKEEYARLILKNAQLKAQQEREQMASTASAAALAHANATAYTAVTKRVEKILRYGGIQGLTPDEAKLRLDEMVKSTQEATMTVAQKNMKYGFGQQTTYQKAPNQGPKFVAWRATSNNYVDDQLRKFHPNPARGAHVYNYCVDFYSKRARMLNCPPEKFLEEYYHSEHYPPLGKLITEADNQRFQIRLSFDREGVRIPLMDPPTQQQLCLHFQSRHHADMPTVYRKRPSPPSTVSSTTPTIQQNVVMDQQNPKKFKKSEVTAYVTTQPLVGVAPLGYRTPVRVPAVSTTKSDSGSPPPLLVVEKMVEKRVEPDSSIVVEETETPNALTISQRTGQPLGRTLTDMIKKRTDGGKKI